MIRHPPSFLFFLLTMLFTAVCHQQIFGYMLRIVKKQKKTLPLARFSSNFTWSPTQYRASSSTSNVHFRRSFAKSGFIVIFVAGIMNFYLFDLLSLTHTNTLFFHWASSHTICTALHTNNCPNLWITNK